MTATHTPGPWSFRKPLEPVEAVEFWIDGAPNGHGATIGPPIADIKIGACPEANARLIAAAPDLLAALKAVVPDMRARIGGIGRQYGAHSEQYAAACARLKTVRAAIAKAEQG